MKISIQTSIGVLVILSLFSMGSLNVKAAQSPGVGPGTADAPGPSPVGSDCMNQLFNMSDCLDFVTQGSNATQPEKSCCPELAGMLDSNPICLCQLVAKRKDFGIEIDVKRALKLPSLCKLQTPDISLCSEVGIPVAAPMSNDGPWSSTGGKNGGTGTSSAQLNVAYLVAALSMAFTLFKF